jgi:hypothetical protein
MSAAIQQEVKEMGPNELKEALRLDGWRIEKHGYEWRRTGVDWWAWKVFDGFSDCTSNEKAPHVALIPWSISSSDHRFRSVTFQVTGEVHGGQWVEFQAYNVQMDNVLEALPHAVNILRAAWSAAALGHHL